MLYLTTSLFWATLPAMVASVPIISLAMPPLVFFICLVLRGCLLSSAPSPFFLQAIDIRFVRTSAIA